MLMPVLLTTQSLLGVWSYTAFNSRGVEIAHGTVNLREPTKTELKRLRPTGHHRVFYLGSKKITCVDPVKYGPHAEGSLQRSPTAVTLTAVSAEVGPKDIRVNLNNGWGDANIWLNGKFNKGAIRGQWGWSTFTGLRITGTFVLSRAKQ